MAFNLHTLGNAVRAGLRLLAKTAEREATSGDHRHSSRPAPHSATPDSATPGRTAPHRPARERDFKIEPAPSYPGDYRGRATVSYAPKPDGDPDPGEVVWTWVPYEEDYTRGKDRPVLIVGHNGPYLLALMLTSRDRVPAGSAGGNYIDVGAGAWDRQDRPSEARLDRILQIRPDGIRREGAVLDRERFEAVAAELRRRHGWMAGRNGQSGR
ncbi:MAG: type II toxin-antitoxin system PemK/MazF family toxin [Pseudarthrobacter sp.]|nr:type II toxin-antitoxin system PemK/MazF family toxin [Pseudarthrobacter sp.]